MFELKTPPHTAHLLFRGLAIRAPFEASDSRSDVADFGRSWGGRGDLRRNICRGEPTSLRSGMFPERILFNRWLLAKRPRDGPAPGWINRD
ncbi:hypothetical protein EVAR_48430_1 [Eumeta japonica]|uniref:Uncharacterized protein n=1 Tax=Eumeta variegata TaxID=151549 RepID=A0A4C1XU56_EUMVA|nr:hypothetical protein EVAR_48430_1 [Eumeta japonica]